MLKNGIGKDTAKQHAAEAFINFISRPDNVIRNMYYIGYTSAISGGEDSRIFEYLDWTYGAEEDEEDVVDYPVGYFFTGDNEDEDYILTVPDNNATMLALRAHFEGTATLEASEVTPFSSRLKYSQVIHDGRTYRLGAPEFILPADVLELARTRVMTAIEERLGKAA